MHIGVYGLGYLGTVTSACLADFGLPVTCYDDDPTRVARLAQGDVPYHEKNLQEVQRRNVRAARLIYSTDIESFASRADLIFIASDAQTYMEETVAGVARYSRPETVFVLVTPVPVGTASRVETKLRAAGLGRTVVSHPIFLTQGCAVEDFNWPDRILLGTSSPEAVQALKQIYRPLAMRGVPVIVTNHETAELVREASTAFMATKISFINELASLCEHVKADAMDLALALGLDKRIAPRCLQPGAGLGGAFVEADLEALAQLASGAGMSLRIVGAARDVNRSLSDRILAKISSVIDSLPGKEVGILGLSFKPHTNSVVASSSVNLAKRLVNQGAKVRVYDPVAMPDAQAELNSVRFCDSPYIAAEGADALVLGTGWPEFRALDYERIKRLQRRPLLVDTKNLLDATRMRAMGFMYVGVGRA
jgi:UDPglucose 6-dehydrogenase